MDMFRPDGTDLVTRRISPRFSSPRRAHARSVSATDRVNATEQIIGLRRLVPTNARKSPLDGRRTAWQPRAVGGLTRAENQGRDG